MSDKKTKIARQELIREAASLHDQLLGEKHCDRSRLTHCPAFQDCIPQAAENIRKRQAKK